MTETVNSESMEILYLKYNIHHTILHLCLKSTETHAQDMLGLFGNKILSTP